MQEFHRQLFLNSADSLRKEIKRITGRKVREAAAEVEPATEPSCMLSRPAPRCRCFCWMADASRHVASQENDVNAA